jgi:hypothetical protein
MSKHKEASEYFYKQMELGLIKNDEQQEVYEMAIEAIEKANKYDNIIDNVKKDIENIRENTSNLDENPLRKIVVETLKNVLEYGRKSKMIDTIRKHIEETIKKDFDKIIEEKVEAFKNELQILKSKVVADAMNKISLSLVDEANSLETVFVLSFKNKDL